MMAKNPPSTMRILTLCLLQALLQLHLTPTTVVSGFSIVDGVGVSHLAVMQQHLHLHTAAAATTALPSPLSQPVGHPPSVPTTIVDPAIVHFAIGAVAGGMGAFAAYPFDFIKSQMQTERGRQLYDNGFDAFLTTIRNNPTDLYRGVVVQVAGIAPEKAIKLGVNDIIRDAFLHSSRHAFPLWCQVLAGATAGACQVVVSSPLEVVKVGLQLNPDKNLRQVWTDAGGVRGTFRGAAACMLRDVVWTAICFPLYNHWVEQGGNPFIVGALAGSFSTFFATPPDMIKTRMLTEKPQPRHQQKQQERAEAVTTSIVEPYPTMAAAVQPQPLSPRSAGFGPTRVATSPRLSTSLSAAVPATYFAMNSDAPSTILNVNPMVDSVNIAAVQATATPLSSSTTRFVSSSYNNMEYSGFPTNLDVDVASGGSRRETKEEEWDKQPPPTENPFIVARQIIEREGVAVMFSGVFERCLGSMPRFGITLGMHEFLEHYATSCGLLH